MEPVTEIFAALAGDIGALDAAVIVGLAWAYLRENKRNDVLVDRIIEMSATTTQAMTDLRNTVERLK